jgi:hypothetical protein
MDTDTPVARADEAKLFTNPWPAVRIGLASVGAALASCLVLGPSLMPVWLGLLLLGLAATAVAVVIAPRSAAVLGCASGVAFVAALVGIESHWDWSATLLFGILTTLAGAAAVLMLLPPVVGRVVVSLAILFHFGGILTAITAAPPQSWLSNWLWTCIYRPYLQFTYLNNAYHFYSPEPGPANLLWFRIEYEKDADKPDVSYTRWIKIPNLDEHGRCIDDLPEGGLRRLPALLFTRRLSLVENAVGTKLAVPNFKEIARRRVLETHNIPLGPGLAIEPQYREPNALSKIWLSSYVRHVARTYKHAARPDKKVHRVKVYRVEHELILPMQYGEGRRLDDPSLYFPFYMGEYDADGKLLSRTLRFDEDGTIVDDRDPFLYWLIPIVPDISPEQKVSSPDYYNYPVINYLKRHAGDKDEDRDP